MEEGPAVNSRNSLDNLGEDDLDQTLYDLAQGYQPNEVEEIQRG